MCDMKSECGLFSVSQELMFISTSFGVMHHSATKNSLVVPCTLSFGEPLADLSGGASFWGEIGQTIAFYIHL